MRNRVEEIESVLESVRRTGSAESISSVWLTEVLETCRGILLGEFPK